MFGEGIPVDIVVTPFLREPMLYARGNDNQHPFQHPSSDIYDDHKGDYYGVVYVYVQQSHGCSLPLRTVVLDKTHYPNSTSIALKFG